MLVKDIMSENIITANPNMSIEAAKQKINANSIGRLVIVEEEKVVGIVSDGDLVPQKSPGVLIENVMSKDVITIYKNRTVQQAAQLLSDNQIGGLPVLDRADNLVGIITAEDIVSGYVNEEEKANLTPESSAIYLSMTRSRDYEKHWLNKIIDYGYQAAITQTGADAENLPIKLRESTTVAAIAREVISENSREKIAVSNAVKDAYTQLNLVNPGLGGGFKIALVRGRGRLAVAIFGKFGHALVDGPEQLAVGVSII